jgi:hypothetical protein
MQIRGPKLGLQGPVVSWQDPWAGDESDKVMRTGTGAVVPSQDDRPEPKAYVQMLKEFGAQFYVHHAFPGRDAEPAMLADLGEAGIDLVLGNEYGNINGPWVPGTNRYDVPDGAIRDALRSGRLIGLLYDEPEHLQINVSQYRKDGWHPHWAQTDGLTLAKAREAVLEAIARRVRHVETLAEDMGIDPGRLPLISEHVFPVSFHTCARAGMAVCPKVMKESFQPLQLATALGAAVQYRRDFWICADLWGPDTGPWFTRFHGFPGHSPEEFDSALKMAYHMAPSHLFTENIDCLLRHRGGTFEKTAFGEVWEAFVRGFVPEHPLAWSHSDAAPDILVIHSDDSNYGQNERLFGNRSLRGAEHSRSIFEIWHLLSRGAIPAHGSCMHIPGFDFPRHVLRKAKSIRDYPLESGFDFAGNAPVHPLFCPMNNALVMDAFACDGEMGDPGLILVGGSSVSASALDGAVKRAESGATAVIGRWLIPEDAPGAHADKPPDGRRRPVDRDRLVPVGRSPGSGGPVPRRRDAVEAAFRSARGAHRAARPARLHAGFRNPAGLKRHPVIRSPGSALSPDVLLEFPGRHACRFLENPAEIERIGIADFLADFVHGQVFALPEEPHRFVDPEHGDVFRRRLPGILVINFAQVGGREMELPGDSLKADLLVEMLAQILLHPLHAFLRVA